MKEHIIRAILYQDMSVKWKDAELNGDVNVHLNVHQKTRQFVEAELDDFLLSDGEAILASFEKTIDGEIYHENPAKMERIEDETNAFRLPIPALVHNTPGEWGVQFFVVADYDPITGDYTNAYPSDIAKFSEHSSIIDDGLTVPTGENLKSVYEQVREDSKYVGDLLIKYSPLADIYDEAVSLIGEYRTFSDVRIMPKADYEALEEKEDGIIYVFSDDTTMEELENAFEEMESFNKNAQETIENFNEDAREAIENFNEDAQETIENFNEDAREAIENFNEDARETIENFNENGKVAEAGHATSADKLTCIKLLWSGEVDIGVSDPSLATGIFTHSESLLNKTLEVECAFPNGTVRYYKLRIERVNSAVAVDNISDYDNGTILSGAIFLGVNEDPTIFWGQSYKNSTTVSASTSDFTGVTETSISFKNTVSARSAIIRKVYEITEMY